MRNVSNKVDKRDIGSYVLQAELYCENLLRQSGLRARFLINNLIWASLFIEKVFDELRFPLIGQLDFSYEWGQLVVAIPEFIELDNEIENNLERECDLLCDTCLLVKEGLQQFPALLADDVDIAILQMKRSCDNFGITHQIHALVEGVPYEDIAA